MKEKAKTACLCKKMGCWRGDDKGIPSYCQANHYLKEIERADKAYAAPEVVDIYSAACVVGKKMTVTGRESRRRWISSRK